MVLQVMEGMVEDMEGMVDTEDTEDMEDTVAVMAMEVMDNGYGYQNILLQNILENIRYEVVEFEMICVQ